MSELVKVVMESKLKLHMMEKTNCRETTRDDDSEEEEDSLSCLPLNTMEDFDEFDELISRDKTTFGKLVISYFNIYTIEVMRLIIYNSV